MTAHGFRAMASTLLNESGNGRRRDRKRLAHKDSDQVRSAYHRGAHWNERVTMAQWWSDHLETFRAGGKIVPFHLSRGLAPVVRLRPPAPTIAFSMPDEWISAAEAFRRVYAATGSGASRAICSRAHAGLIEAKAAKIDIGDLIHEEYRYPGILVGMRRGCLEQNWPTGDFETWIDRKTHESIRCIVFAGGIVSLIGPALESRISTDFARPIRWQASGGLVGRLWVEMCRQLMRATFSQRSSPIFCPR